MNQSTVSRTLDFQDNKIYATICGPMDRHLALIETIADVSISRSGNRLLIQGLDQDVSRVAELISHLTTRIGKKGDIDEEDVKGALRFAGYQVNTVPKKQPPEMRMLSNDIIRTPRKEIVGRSQNQGLLINLLKNKPLVFGIGPAGTGKTYLAVAAAVEALTSGRVDRIILSRPAVEAGERIGFLPGDMKEKVDPYMQPLYDALNDTLPVRQLTRMYEDKTIEIAPLAFMRGRTLSRAFVVLDEAQNTTIQQMKMFLTRLGEDSIMAITGDQTQIDLPHAQMSGLMDAVERLKKIDAVGLCRFTDMDVVRHPLVAEIIRAYER